MTYAPRLGKPVDARTAARLREHVAGNPLYLRALVEELPAAMLHDEVLPLLVGLIECLIVQVQLARLRSAGQYGSDVL